MNAVKISDGDRRTAVMRAEIVETPNDFHMLNRLLPTMLHGRLRLTARASGRNGIPGSAFCMCTSYAFPSRGVLRAIPPDLAPASPCLVHPTARVDGNAKGLQAPSLPGSRPRRRFVH
jgi:hypothetical protein